MSLSPGSTVSPMQKRRRRSLFELVGSYVSETFGLGGNDSEEEDVLGDVTVGTEGAPGGAANTPAPLRLADGEASGDRRRSVKFHDDRLTEEVTVERYIEDLEDTEEEDDSDSMRTADVGHTPAPDPVGERVELTAADAPKGHVGAELPDLSSMKYKELQSELRARGVSMKGKKVDLMARLEEEMLREQKAEEEADAEEAGLEGLADEEEGKVENMADVEEADFEGLADEEEGKFENMADVEEAAFEGLADLGEAEWEEEADRAAGRWEGRFVDEALRMAEEEAEGSPERRVSLEEGKAEEDGAKMGEDEMEFRARQEAMRYEMEGDETEGDDDDDEDAKGKRIESDDEDEQQEDQRLYRKRLRAKGEPFRKPRQQQQLSAGGTKGHQGFEGGLPSKKGQFFEGGSSKTSKKDQFFEGGSSKTSKKDQSSSKSSKKDQFSSKSSKTQETSSGSKRPRSIEEVYSSRSKLSRPEGSTSDVSEGVIRPHARWIGPIEVARLLCGRTRRRWAAEVSFSNGAAVASHRRHPNMPWIDPETLVANRTVVIPHSAFGGVADVVEEEEEEEEERKGVEFSGGLSPEVERPVASRSRRMSKPLATTPWKPPQAYTPGSVTLRSLANSARNGPKAATTRHHASSSVFRRSGLFDYDQPEPNTRTLLFSGGGGGGGGGGSTKKEHRFPTDNFSSANPPQNLSSTNPPQHFSSSNPPQHFSSSKPNQSYLDLSIAPSLPRGSFAASRSSALSASEFALEDHTRSALDMTQRQAQRFGESYVVREIQAALRQVDDATRQSDLDPSPDINPLAFSKRFTSTTSNHTHKKSPTISKPTSPPPPPPSSSSPPKPATSSTKPQQPQRRPSFSKPNTSPPPQQQQQPKPTKLSFSKTSTSPSPKSKTSPFATAIPAHQPSPTSSFFKKSTSPPKTTIPSPIATANDKRRSSSSPFVFSPPAPTPAAAGRRMELDELDHDDFTFSNPTPIAPQRNTSFSSPSEQFAFSNPNPV